MKDYAETADELKKIEATVLDVLKVDLKSRNSDLYLIFEIWKKQGINIQIDPEDIPKLVHPESIRRSRAKIQNDMCLYPPTSVAVAIKRKIKEETLKKYYSYQHMAEWNDARYLVK